MAQRSMTNFLRHLCFWKCQADVCGVKVRKLIHKKKLSCFALRRKKDQNMTQLLDYHARYIPAELKGL